MKQGQFAISKVISRVLPFVNPIKFYVHWVLNTAPQLEEKATFYFLSLRHVFDCNISLLWVFAF